MPDSHFVPDGEMRLLSPQHWSRAMGQKKEAGEDTNGTRTRLHWNGGKNKLIVPLGLNDNVAMFDTAPGHKKCKAFCSTTDNEESKDNPTLLADLNVISKDEQEETKSHTHTHMHTRTRAHARC